MTTITNTGKRRLGLSGRPSLVLNPGQCVEISATQYHSFRENRTTVRWMESGLLALDDLPEGAVDPDMELKKPEQAVDPDMELKKPEQAEEVDEEVEVDEEEEEVDELPEGVTGEGVEIHQVSKGWYAVYVNGILVTDSNVRKSQAEEIAEEYK